MAILVPLMLGVSYVFHLRSKIMLITVASSTVLPAGILVIVGTTFCQRRVFQNRASIASPWSCDFVSGPQKVERGHAKNQEWPRQTKPKKGQFMNFSQGHSGTKVQFVNRACFPKEKHQNSQKWVKFMNFSFWPFLWFGG